MSAGHLLQVVASLDPLDAVSDFARDLGRLAVARGWTHAIAAHAVHPSCAGEARGTPEDRADLTLVHHSLRGFPVARLAGRGGRRVVVHHSVTPAACFAGISPEHEAAARDGREDLRRLAAAVGEAVGVSRYDAQEARDAGFARVGLLPVLPTPARLEAAPRRATLARLADLGWREGDLLALVVGRLAPNKRVEDALAAHAVLTRLVERSWLVIVGTDSGFEGYGTLLRDVATRLAVPGVVFAGAVADDDLVDLYRSSTALVCASEHEGRGLPLIEAMHHGLPVVARAAAAVPETLGEAGVLFERFDAVRWAEALLVLHECSDLRDAQVAAGRARVAAFDPTTLARAFERLLAGELPAP